MLRRQLTKATKPLVLGTFASATALYGANRFTSNQINKNKQNNQANPNPALLSHFHLASTIDTDSNASAPISIPDQPPQSQSQSPQSSPPTPKPMRFFDATPVSTNLTVDSPPTAGPRTKRSPADGSATNRVIDDGYETVTLPVRVLPDWAPITREEADALGTMGDVRYAVEWVADFCRNRLDDITYLFTGEMQKILLDPSRYERTYNSKSDQMPFNAYYEAVYRGLYDSHDIKMKSNGSVPRWDYSKWLAINPRPQVYLDMAIPDPDNPSVPPTTPERIVIQLYYDYMPNSTKNFVGLCDGFIDGDRFLSYNHNLVHRVDQGHAFFAGDVIRRDGTQAMAFINNGADWKFMKDEKANLPHDGPGCVVLDNKGPNTNSSHFFISQRAMPELDGQYLVVGHVMEGIEAVKKIDRIPVSDEGVPLFPVKILKSGIYVRDQDRDDPFTELKGRIPELKETKPPLTPGPVENNPNFVYP